MASTFSPSLRIELIGDGDQSGIWGQTTNNNLGGLIEQAIAGVTTITMADANYTMTNFNGVSDESRNQVLVLTGTNTAQRNLIAPLVEKTYTVKNTTTGGFAVQIIGSSGVGVIVPNGVTTTVYCDGTNFYSGINGIVGNLAVTGSTTLTGALNASTATFSGAISSVSPTFTGTPTAPTAAGGTNTTQIATTAFVQSATSGLGTMATQNANNVNITGGAINGTTIGATTASTVRGTTGTFTSSVTATSFSGAGTGLTGTASGLSIGGNAATATTATNATNATNATTAASCSGNSATATSPQSGGSFITSSNIGSQSVNFANSAGNGGVTSVNGQTGAASVGSVTSVATGNGLQGGTITSSGTLSVACPGFNTVGSYVGCYAPPGSYEPNNNYAAGSGANTVNAFRSDGTPVISGTWKWMNTWLESGSGLICRVS